MVVSLVNAGVAVLRMRPSRKRRFVEYPIDNIYVLAVKAEVARLKREKEAARKSRRAKKE